MAQLTPPSRTISFYYFSGRIMNVNMYDLYLLEDLISIHMYTDVLYMHNR